MDSRFESSGVPWKKQTASAARGEIRPAVREASAA
jgi:hypothetical protein